MPKAYVFTRYGGPETEALVEVDQPRPGPGEVLVAVRAAGVNPVDWKQRTGYRRPGETGSRAFPAVFGQEVSGVVREIGAGVDGFAVGDEVFGGTAAGGYAEYALLPATVTAHKPAELPFTEAATLPVAAATAYDGIRQLDLPAGATVLITGAGGGVGSAALQIARALGLRAVGVASEGEVLTEAASLLTDHSKLITAGAPAPEVEKLGGARVERARNAAVLDALAQLVVSGRLDPHVTRTFPLDQAGEALRTVEDGHARGKIVIEISE
jgi:NADPH:quinone reductase-like Zn-dependent oxidoreductase